MREATHLEFDLAHLDKFTFKRLEKALDSCVDVFWTLLRLSKRRDKVMRQSKHGEL